MPQTASAAAKLWVLLRCVCRFGLVWSGLPGSRRKEKRSMGAEMLSRGCELALRERRKRRMDSLGGVSALAARTK